MGWTVHPAAAAPSLGDPSGGDADSHGCEDGFAWNGEKCLEIAGYWEDGLARFADGTKEVKTYKAAEVAKDDGDFSETFSGHTDDVPNGPMSVGVDVAFPGSKALFGLAEHASQFALKKTTGGGGYDASQYPQGAYGYGGAYDYGAAQAPAPEQAGPPPG